VGSQGWKLSKSPPVTSRIGYGSFSQLDRTPTAVTSDMRMMNVSLAVILRLPVGGGGGSGLIGPVEGVRLPPVQESWVREVGGARSPPGSGPGSCRTAFDSPTRGVS